LTIDVEEFFQVHALSRAITMDEWGNYPSSVTESTELILNLLDVADIKATFFCLGWIAERHPDLIRRIHKAGHEIASHGYAHKVIYDQEPAVFREDVAKAKAILEEITGAPVLGYRAPTYSITKQTLWALDTLEELGFIYDSSIFPIRHDNYGIPDAPRFPHRLSPRRLVEFPISTVNIGSANLPIAGGGYFRLLPYPVTRQGLKTITAQGHPFIFYVHPWEFNPGIPRVASLSALSRFRTYVGLTKTQHRFQRLLTDFDFTTASNVLADLGLI
jgi:polysaccharide deacetylase family protein (PEP-CTERM system associated)